MNIRVCYEKEVTIFLHPLASKGGAFVSKLGLVFKIDNLRQRVVDFTFSLLTLHFSLFSTVDFGGSNK